MAPGNWAAVTLKSLRACYLSCFKQGSFKGDIDIDTDIDIDAEVDMDIHIDVDIDVELYVDIHSCVGCLKGVFEVSSGFSVI